MSIADRLWLVGKRILELQVSLALFHGSSATPFAETQDEYGREPFRHPALEGLAGLSVESKFHMLNVKRTARLAEEYQLDSVVRWKPKDVCSISNLIYNCATTQTERS